MTKISFGRGVQFFLRVLVGLITLATAGILIAALYTGLTDLFGPEIPTGYKDKDIYELSSESEFLESLKYVESDSASYKDVGQRGVPPMVSSEIMAELEQYRYYNSWRSTKDFILPIFWLIVAVVAIAPQAIWLFGNYGGITWDQKPSLIPWWFYLIAFFCVLGAVLFYWSGLKFFSLPLLGLAAWQAQQILDRYMNKNDQSTREEIQSLRKKAVAPLVPQADSPRTIPDDVIELWRQAVWLAKNFRELWPGEGFRKKDTDTYLATLEEFGNFIDEHSIALPGMIMISAKKLISAIHEYKSGKDLRWIPPYDPESSRKGGKQMTSGAKNFNRAFGELQLAIREEYGVQ